MKRLASWYVGQKRDDKVFVFGNESDVVRSDDRVVRLRAAICNFADLFNAYYSQLSLPGYVGRNWNALSDCLRDLSWVDQRRVIIAHEALPNLPPPDTAEYLDVLRECVMDWRSNEAHELTVLFPKTCEDDVLNYMMDS